MHQFKKYVTHLGFQKWKLSINPCAPLVSENLNLFIHLQRSSLTVRWYLCNLSKIFGTYLKENKTSTNFSSSNLFRVLGLFSKISEDPGDIFQVELLSMSGLIFFPTALAKLPT